MAGRHDDVDLRAQRLDVFAELIEISSVRPGDDERRHAGPVCWRNARSHATHRHMIRGVTADHGNPGRVDVGLVIGRPVN